MPKEPKCGCPESVALRRALEEIVYIVKKTTGQRPSGEEIKRIAREALAAEEFDA